MVSDSGLFVCLVFFFGGGKGGGCCCFFVFVWVFCLGFFPLLQKLYASSEDIDQTPHSEASDLCPLFTHVPLMVRYFTSLSTLLKSYGDDEMVIMKGSLQRSAEES